MSFEGIIPDDKVMSTLILVFSQPQQKEGKKTSSFCIEQNFSNNLDCSEISFFLSF
jgi:hypothetical protein